MEIEKVVRSLDSIHHQLEELIDNNPEMQHSFANITSARDYVKTARDKCLGIFHDESRNATVVVDPF